MARSIRSATLETRSARLRLLVSKVPVFIRIGPKVGRGYRRNQTAGTWVVRLSDGKGRNSRQAIGSADDYEEPDGEKVLDFWQAQERSRKLTHGDGPAIAAPRGTPITVRQALDRYEADLKTRGGDTTTRVWRLMPLTRTATTVTAYPTTTRMARWKMMARGDGDDAPWIIQTSIGGRER